MRQITPMQKLPKLIFYREQPAVFVNLKQIVIALFH
jgi:hypothetical protein